jgi:hypothetical protein
MREVSGYRIRLRRPGRRFIYWTGKKQKARDEAIASAGRGGNNPDLWADTKWQDFMWGEWIAACFAALHAINLEGLS